MPSRAGQDAARSSRLSGDRTDRRARLIRAAVAVADRDGLEAVSVRRIADEVGMRPMTLYTYVSSKEELLELMAEQIVGEVLIREPLPADWRAALETIVSRSHQVFIAHPWVLTISQHRTNLGSNALRHAEQLLTAIAPLGLPPRESWEVLYLINDYTLGHALRIAHAAEGSRNDYPGFDPADYPHLARALIRASPGRDARTFHHGLNVLLDAIEHRYGGSG